MILCCVLFSPLSYGNNSDLVDLNNFIKSQSTFGGIGLIETPTARFSDDGEFVFGISAEAPYNRLFAKMQFFPWLEGVVRYTEGRNYIYAPGSHQTWKDKGMDIKFRLFQEGKIIPELALGFYDLGGTGDYSAEYIVASKRFKKKSRGQGK